MNWICKFFGEIANSSGDKQIILNGGDVMIEDKCCGCCEVSQRLLVEISAERDTLHQALVHAKQELIKQVFIFFQCFRHALAGPEWGGNKLGGIGSFSICFGQNLIANICYLKQIKMTLRQVMCINKWNEIEWNSQK